MNPFRVTLTRLLASALAGAALFTLIGTGPAAAQVRLRVPGEPPDGGPGIPAYTLTDLPFVFHTDQWAAIVFYRAPDCVPGDVNLLQFPIPAAFACPLTVSGFELWDDPNKDLGPRQAVSSGLAVPVWFVPWPTLQAAIADDVLTKSDLDSLDPLKGVATTFHEIRHPFVPPGEPGGAKVPHLTITASVVLLDGSERSFQCELTSVSFGSTVHVRIVFR